MKKKLVLWGKKDESERKLLAFELMAAENQVRIYTFPEEVATEAFSRQMMDEWREDKPFELPDQRTEQVVPLQITESIVPEGFSVERADLVQRAQTEWHFLVLSSKMHQAYLSDLDVLSEKIAALQAFQSPVWEELKGFWGRVQEQISDRNLLREHAQELREKTNALFGEMKTLRRKQDEEFRQKSKVEKEKFMEALGEIEERLEKGMRLQALFEDLKKLQRAIKDASLTREHRSAVWDRLDKNFKAVKEKKFGGKQGDSRSPLERINRRYEGLLKAQDKMEHSIRRDEKELQFEHRKADHTDNQLENQIRQAKVLMIEERIRSKKEKLENILKTKADLERRIQKEEQREAKQQEELKKEALRKAAEEKIAQQIREEADARKGEEEKLKKAASSITRKADDSESAGPDHSQPIADLVEDVHAVLNSLSALSDQPA